MKNIEQQVDDALTGLEEIRQLYKRLTLTSYDIEQIRTTFNEMFERFCPFKVGDRVRLVRDWTDPRGDSPGWHHHMHTLVRDNVAVVKGRDFRNGKFIFDLLFDKETWVDKDGVEHPVSKKGTFCFREDWLEHIDQSEVPW